MSQFSGAARTLAMNGQRRHMRGFTGWMVQSVSQKTQ
jgi:hypothetical protein